ncbi:unnamed protein product [Dovyalis caffra]|uniref:Uncharacterized protein n=1 Tax=Dovyalis caffra TaxID=77055 RepID=A0AAV1QYG4_9ROSI|nr:unnamed protein product [Dovyalis caffra]
MLIKKELIPAAEIFNGRNLPKEKDDDWHEFMPFSRYKIRQILFGIVNKNKSKPADRKWQKKAAGGFGESTDNLYSTALKYQTTRDSWRTGVYCGADKESEWSVCVEAARGIFSFCARGGL